MRNTALLLNTIMVVGCASQTQQPVTALLEGIKGQTCRGTLQGDVSSDVVYTIAEKDGKWVVHDVYGTTGASAMRDVGWLPATVNGSTLSFVGATSSPITLTATGPHTVEAGFTTKSTFRTGSALLTCQ
jgi:hypothetical protein